MNPTYARHGDVALITLDNPPVNGMGHALRSAIADGLRAAAAEEAVRAVVLTGAGSAFSGGADIREFNPPRALAEPTLRGLIDMIESGGKPVVAAINGTCFGGGLELSLACHYRVAKADAALALPEVKLGLVPGAGGTQRLPRALGVERAVEMITTGNPVKAASLDKTELIDAILTGDFLASAVAFARNAAAAPLRRLRDMPVEPPGAGFFESARKSVAAAARGLSAPLACVDAIEASATLPFDEGIRREREIFLGLIESDESKALRHAFFAERA